MALASGGWLGTHRSSPYLLYLAQSSVHFDLIVESRMDPIGKFYGKEEDKAEAVTSC